MSEALITLSTARDGLSMASLAQESPEQLRARLRAWYHEALAENFIVQLQVLAEMGGVADGPVTLGVQPHHLSLDEPFEKAPALKVRTQVSEIAGSESFVHVLFGDKRWVMLAHGVCNLDPELDIDIHLDTRHLMAFGADGTSLSRNAG